MHFYNNNVINHVVNVVLASYYWSLATLRLLALLVLQLLVLVPMWGILILLLKDCSVLHALAEILLYMIAE